MYSVANLENVYCNVCGMIITVKEYVDGDGLCSKCSDNFIRECETCGREISCNKIWGNEGICEYCEGI